MYKLILKPIFECLYCKKKKSGRRGQKYCTESHKKMYWKKANWNKYLESQRKSYQKKTAKKRLR